MCTGWCPKHCPACQQWQQFRVKQHVLQQTHK
jgi:hypothetical protein